MTVHMIHFVQPNISRIVSFQYVIDVLIEVQLIDNAALVSKCTAKWFRYTSIPVYSFSCSFPI